MPYTKKCPVCGRYFEAKSETMLYCGPECRKAARRKYKNEWNRADRAKKAGKRQAIRLEVSAAISAEADANAERAKAAFKKKCAEGAIGALMLKEKSKSGIMSKKYWELFAAARIQEAEKSGTMSKTTVNGYSVYDDLFADSVVESMKDGAAVIIKSGRISKY